MLSPSIRPPKYWITQDRVISFLVVFISIIAWGWNLYISFVAESGELTSKIVHDFVIRFPIVIIPIIFGLGSWGGFRQWLKTHPWGLGYLAAVCGHIFWVLPH